MRVAPASRTGSRPQVLRAGLLVLALVQVLADADRAACAPARRLVDGTGEAVALPAAAQRIVCLAPDLTEIVFDLGAGERVVGVCAGCDRPAAVAGLPRVGPLIQPSVEAILLLEPDLVLATSQGNPLESLRRLRRLGLTVFGVDVAGRGLDGVAEQVLIVARAVGREATGHLRVGEFERRLADVRLRAGGVPGVSACWLVWTDPFIAAGRGSFLDDLLGVVGASNACRRGRDEYPRLAREDLLLAQPDVVFVATGQVDSRDALGSWAGAIPAVRRGAVLDVDPDAFLRPTTGLATSAERLLELLEPFRRSASTDGDRPDGRP